MTLCTRLIGLAGFVLSLLLGAFFSTVVAVAALLSAVALIACSWLGWSPRWLRPLWYGGLLAGAGVMYFAAPTAGVGGAISSCADIPTLTGKTEEPHDPSRAAPAQNTSLAAANDPVHEQGGLAFEVARFVSVEKGYVRYEERVDLHLKRGHFINLDLTELGSQSARQGSATQILVGGDGMVAETFQPNELTGTLGLSTQPRSVWVELRMQVPPGAVAACHGAALMPFQRVQLAWPQPLDMPIGGRVKLPASDAPVPFNIHIGKERTQQIDVLLPRRSLFVQRPVQLQAAASTSIAAEAFDRFTLSDGNDAGDLAMVAELLPDQSFIRSPWGYERRALFFPLNWALALVYVLVASALGDVFLSRHAFQVDGNS